MKKIKLNIIDYILLLALIGVICFVGLKTFENRGREAENKYILSVYCEEVPEFVAELIKVGDEVSDEGKNISLGNVLSVKLSDGVGYMEDESGKLKKMAKEGYNSVLLKISTDAVPFEHGIKIEGNRYSVGHSVVLYAGKAKISGRISDIKEWIWSLKWF